MAENKKSGRFVWGGKQKLEISKSDINRLRQVEKEVNDKLIHNSFVTISDFTSALKEEDNEFHI